MTSLGVASLCLAARARRMARACRCARSPQAPTRPARRRSQLCPVAGAGLGELRSVSLRSTSLRARACGPRLPRPGPRGPVSAQNAVARATCGPAAGFVGSDRLRHVPARPKLRRGPAARRERRARASRAARAGPGPRGPIAKRSPRPRAVPVPGKPWPIMPSLSSLALAGPALGLPPVVLDITNIMSTWAGLRRADSTHFASARKRPPPGRGPRAGPVSGGRAQLPRPSARKCRGLRLDLSSAAGGVSSARADALAARAGLRPALAAPPQGGGSPGGSGGVAALATPDSLPNLLARPAAPPL